MLYVQGSVGLNNDIISWCMFIVLYGSKGALIGTWACVILDLLPLVLQQFGRITTGTLMSNPSVHNIQEKFSYSVKIINPI